MSRFAVNSQGLEEQLQKQSQRILEMEQSHYESQHRLATSTSLAVRYSRYTCLSYAQQPCSLAWLLLWQEEASCSSGKQSARTFAAFPPSIGKSAD
jgi:hypothetical protein